MSDFDETHDEGPEGEPVDEPETVDDALWAVSDAVDRLAGALRVRARRFTVTRWRESTTSERGLAGQLELECGCNARIECDGRSAPTVRYTGAEEGCLQHRVPPRVRREDVREVPF